MPHAASPTPLALGRRGPLRGRVTVPGDKSISHRALMLAALAVGESRIEGMLEGEDVLATAAALRAMGATIERDGDGVWHVHGVGVGGLLQPAQALEMGNSGTSTRLLMGLVASHPITATFVGDASLSARPMARVIEPLARMGADITASPGGRLPLMMRGICPAVPIEYALPVASAQVKSAVLLAGLNTPGITRVVEPVPTRDHSERMLAGFGARVTVEDTANGRVISVRGEADLTPQDIVVPGDPSSAAFWLVAASIVPGSDLIVANVGLNPTRTGLIAALRMMGADIVEVDRREVGGEPVADLRVRHAALTAIEVPSTIAPTMIDEYPILFVAAAFAHGRTVARGAHELRVKESDRIAAMAAALTTCGVAVEEYDDGMAITGTGGDALRGGGTIASLLDHRIAMSMVIAGLHAREPIAIDDVSPIATSYPGFLATLDALAAGNAAPLGGGGVIIAVDGPAASGKGTIAKALARHYALPHLDTGLLYRAVAATVQRRGLDPLREADALAACDFDELALADPVLREDAVGQLASIVSAHPAVRTALFDRQQRFAAQAGGAILDGRDIGTVIAPAADAKLFVTAAPTVRAARRHAELAGRGDPTDYATVLADIRARDERDSSRSTAPLVMAQDAALLDTSELSIEASVERAVVLVERARMAE